MDRFDFFQKHYLKEFDRRDELRRYGVFTLAVITALATGALGLARSISSAWSSTEAVLGLLLIPCAVSILIAITDLVRAQVGHEYCYIGDSEKNREWYGDVLRNKGCPDAASLEFEEMLIAEYAGCTSHNTFVNDTKSAHTHRCHVAAATALCCLAVAAVPYLMLNSSRLPSQSAQPNPITWSHR